MTQLSDKFRAISDSIDAGADQVRDGMAKRANALAGLRGQLIELQNVLDVNQLHGRLQQIVDSMPVDVSREVSLASLIVGKVNANLYRALAEMMETPAEAQHSGRMAELRKKNSDYQRRLNTAFVKEDWNEWQQIIDERSTGAGRDTSAGTKDTEPTTRPASDEGTSIDIA